MGNELVKVTVEAPEAISQQARDNAQRKAREAAVLSLWEEGEITASRAAEELALGIHDFLDLLAARGIPVESGPLDLQAIDGASQTLARRGS